MAKKNQGLVLSVKHRPPLSITMIGAILLLLMSSKEQIIDSLPLTNKETIEFIGSWYMWALKACGALVAILQIVLGVKKDTPPEYKANFNTKP